MIGKLHQAERQNAVDREVAAKALGYTGISGRSATVLSNLIQYGLLEKTAKNEVRVSRRAVEILYPDSAVSKTAAIRDAAKEPELFQRVAERFTDGMPSANALQAYFIKEGFTDTAIPSAIRAFQETFAFAQNAVESGSNTDRPALVSESHADQTDMHGGQMMGATQTHVVQANPVRVAEIVRAQAIEQPEYHVVGKKIRLGGVVANQEQAQELIDFIRAMMPLMRKLEPSTPSAETEHDPTGPLD